MCKVGKKAHTLDVCDDSNEEFENTDSEYYLYLDSLSLCVSAVSDTVNFKSDSKWLIDVQMGGHGFTAKGHWGRGICDF